MIANIIKLNKPLTFSLLISNAENSLVNGRYYKTGLTSIYNDVKYDIYLKENKEFAIYYTSKNKWVISKNSKDESSYEYRSLSLTGKWKSINRKFIKSKI